MKRRIVMLLVGEDVSDSEFRAAAEWLRNDGLTECLEAASGIRRLLGTPHDRAAVPPQASPDDVRTSATPQASAPPKPRGSASRHDSVPAQVESLLVKESGLMPSNAIRLLVSHLGYDRPLPAKKGFRFVVERLSEEVGGSRVLMAAHQIRNAHVHGVKAPAWNLGSVDDHG